MNQTIAAFGYPDTRLKEYNHWVILLRPKQVTIGSLVVAAKSEALHLGELGQAAWTEFSTVATEVELALINTYGAEKFNYLALMMKDPNVHFHFIPRYSQPVTINGKTYSDPDWPSKTEMRDTELDEESFESVRTTLRAWFSS